LEAAKLALAFWLAAGLFWILCIIYSVYRSCKTTHTSLIEFFRELWEDKQW
jgi:hypothetical protein